MKAIFIDRDGVINKDPGGGWTEHSYVTRVDEFHFLEGSREAIKDLTEAGYEIVIISNQGGISKGHFTLDDLDKINKKMLAGIKASGGRIRSLHYCPHQKSDGCDCKKPGTGLFKAALKGLKIDLKETFFIGDGSMDVEAGKRVGCKTILLLSGKSSKDQIEGWEYKPDYIKKDLREAVDWLLAEGE
jgi:histidinol-phosphate phosphatase family protein